MEHRRIGRAGLKTSVLSFGSWVTFGDQLGIDTATDCITAAWEAGVTFFDNAEAYAGGESERIMGEVFRRMDLDRRLYTISTKLYWGITEGPNTKNTLNRKYLLEGIDGSLGRLGLDYVDMLLCHRADPETPMDEVVQAMSDIVASGKALYWGTSEWSAAEYREACKIAEARNLRAPILEQPQYNLVERDKVETEFADLYDDFGMGLTTWSPLASGLLTGKYLDGIPADSRGALPAYSWLQDKLTDQQALDQVRRLKGVADDLGASLAQLSIAWCAANPHVSTVITGASRVDQVHHNMEAADLIPSLTPEVLGRIDEIFA
jgi:voltage-dependent potassium channel beta subunit